MLFKLYAFAMLYVFMVVQIQILVVMVFQCWDVPRLMLGTQKERAVCFLSHTMGNNTIAAQMLTVIGCGVLPRETTMLTINGVTVEVSKGFEVIN